MPVAIRAARPEDAHAIAEVHVEGWRWGYRDIARVMQVFAAHGVEVVGPPPS